jgi:hypothetical protein
MGTNETASDTRPANEPTSPSDATIRADYGWAIGIVRKHFSRGLEELCSSQFLGERYQEFERRNDPIYAALLRGMGDPALSRTFVSYWTIGQTMATRSRFWLEDAVAEIIIHQVKNHRREATHVYSQSMLSRGALDRRQAIADMGEEELEHVAERRPWRDAIQRVALERIDVIVGRQERQRVERRQDPLRPRAWNRDNDRAVVDRDRQHLDMVAQAITGPPESTVTLQCNLLVIEPDVPDGSLHAWAIRYVNPRTLASHPARKQERVNLLRLYALLVQEKILRDPRSIHVCVAELLPRAEWFALGDRWPDYFSATTHWSTERLWGFIGVPYEVLGLAMRDVAHEFRVRLRSGLDGLLPRRRRRTTVVRRSAFFGHALRRSGR